MILLLSLGDDQRPAEVLAWPTKFERQQWHGLRMLISPSDSQVQTALDLVATQRALSVAFFDVVPPHDRLWLAHEFWRNAVTDRGVHVEQLVALGWRPDAHDGYTVWKPPSYDNAKFAGDALSGERVAVEVAADCDIDDMELFGPFASGQRGGSSALMALSGARPGIGMVRLRSPSALDLDVIDERGSLPHLVQDGAVSITAVGGSSSTPVSQLDLDHFGDPDTARHRWMERDLPPGYLLLIEVAALVDPPVGIPPGHIFEQFSVNGVQTLAAASGVSSVVVPGSLWTVVVPAWCLNRELAAPAGQGVRATPLRARYAAGTSQESVWADRQLVMAREI